MYGGTYAQIGEWSRGFHATQGMGSLKDEPKLAFATTSVEDSLWKNFLDDLTEEVPKTLSCLADYCEKSYGKKAAADAQSFAEAAMHAFPDSSQVLQHICQLQSLC